MTAGAICFALFCFWTSHLLSGKQREGEELCTGLSPAQQLKTLYFGEKYFVAFPSLQQLHYQPRASTKVLTLTSDVALVAIDTSITFCCANLDLWRIQELFPRSKSRQLSFLLTGYLYSVLPSRIGDPLALAISVLAFFSFSKRESHGAHLIPAPSLHKGAV